MVTIKEVIEKELKKIDEKKYEVSITHCDSNISMNFMTFSAIIVEKIL